MTPHWICQNLDKYILVTLKQGRWKRVGRVGRPTLFYKNKRLVNTFLTTVSTSILEWPQWWSYEDKFNWENIFAKNQFFYLIFSDFQTNGLSKIGRHFRKQSVWKIWVHFLIFLTMKIVFESQAIFDDSFESCESQKCFSTTDLLAKMY